LAPSCVFCDIVAGRLATKKVFENRVLMAFHDRQPQAPVHILIIPKQHLTGLHDVTTSEPGQKLLGRMMLLARHIATELNIEKEGYRLVLNAGDDAGQAVRHLHLHMLAGRPFEWPPG
jgi:histidine triad (HIT) family protein